MESKELNSAAPKAKPLIHVTLQTLLEFKKIIGRGDVILEIPEGTTVRELLTIIIERWGEEIRALLFESDSQTLCKHVSLMVNGQSISFLNKMETVLSDGDQFLIFPPAGGG